MLLDSEELPAIKNQTWLPLLPRGVLDSEPLANTNPLYGKEVGNGCALQVLKNTFAVWEQMLGKKKAHSSKNQSYYCIYLKDTVFLSNTQVTWIWYCIYLSHLQVLEYITLLQLFNVHLFKATGHNRSQATMSKLLVWSLMLQLTQGDA